ncbi:hypothetical protein RND71_013532 [Anisodus tanguticus]|uniref:Uncharacterized protein n=1 Tax=Anisodus tanguticus TaxID=243964 RepID=A0AAE1S9M8_9SOLA|nr:hypothetical protein RND71_013532 [Anisodus tanguticus]
MPEDLLLGLTGKHVSERRKCDRCERKIDHKEKKTNPESKGRMPHQHPKNAEQTKGKLLHSLSMNSINKKDQAQVEVVDNGQKDEQKECRNDTAVTQENVFSRENRPNQRQPLTNMNLNGPSSYRERGFGESYTSNPSKSPLRTDYSNTHMPMWRASNYGGNASRNNSPLRMDHSNRHMPMWRGSSYGELRTGKQGMVGVMWELQNVHFKDSARNKRGLAAFMLKEDATMGIVAVCKANSQARMER